MKPNLSFTSWHGLPKPGDNRLDNTYSAGMSFLQFFGRRCILHLGFGISYLDWNGQNDLKGIAFVGSWRGGIEYFLTPDISLAANGNYYFRNLKFDRSPILQSDQLTNLGLGFRFFLRDKE